MASNRTPPDQALDAIAREMTSADRWNNETLNRIAELVTSAGYKVAPRPLELDIKCPECGNTNHERFQLRETTFVYHSIDRIEKGVLHLTSDVDSEGQADYVAICQECTHEGDPESFGMGHHLNWEFE